MNKEQGSVLVQVITTAAISLILVSSITMMLRNYTHKTEVNRFIKKRNTLGTRIGNMVLIPDVLLGSAKLLPEDSSSSSHALYGNYMLRQCLGLAASEVETYVNENDESKRSGPNLTSVTKNCLLKETGTARDENAWYPLLLIGNDNYKDGGASDCLFTDEAKWENPLSCFLAGQTAGDSPAKQVAFSFDGEPGKKDKSHPLLSFVFFRPFCDDDGSIQSCYRAKKIQFRYNITHVFETETLEDCSDTRCEANSPIELGIYPKEEDYYAELTPADIIGNECNENARVQVIEGGGIQCQCIAPYKQSLLEKNGEIFYKENEKGPVCELIDPLCEEYETLVGQTPDGIPICERVREEIFDGTATSEEFYEFTKTFLSIDSFTRGVCDSNSSDEEGLCSFNSCRYKDSGERVDGWLNNLDIECQSYLSFVRSDSLDGFKEYSYFEELVWDFTETTLALVLTLSETALWIPKLLTEKEDMEDPNEYMEDPNEYSAYNRRDLLFGNVGTRLTPDYTERVTLFDQNDLEIPYCNAEKVLADNAPSDAPTTGDPRCPLVVCKYTMTCQYGRSDRSY
jgi:hypothetical protein